MNQINFNTGKNYYHTYKEQNVTVIENVAKGESIITGYTQESIEGGGYAVQATERTAQCS